MKRVGLVAAALFLFTGAGFAATVEVACPEFQVNQGAAGNQDHANVALRRDGVFMVVWHDFGTGDGDASGIAGRTFSAPTGEPLTDEFVVNDGIVGYQRVPDVATYGNLEFAVTWDGGLTMVGADYDVFAKTLSPLGETLAPEATVSDSSGAAPVYPTVAMYPDGSYVILWDQKERAGLVYYLKWLDKNGNLLRGPVQVNEVPCDVLPDVTGRFGLPDIAVNAAGDAFAVWERITGTDSVVVGRRYNPSTNLFSREVVISAPALGVQQRRPAVDMNDSGDVVVTWAEYAAGSSSGDIYARKYYAKARKWGSRILPHASTEGDQHRSDVRVTKGGHFVLTWTSKDPTYDNDIYMRLYSSKGVPVTNGFMVNDTRVGSQSRPAVDLVEYPDHLMAVVTWEGDDGGGLDVFAKIYRFLP